VSRHTDPRWYVVSTYSHAEHSVTAAIQARGFQTYLPMVAVRRVGHRGPWRSKVFIVEIPLFPSYCFVAFNRYSDQWGPICATRGVFRLLMDGDNTPQPCQEGAVEALQATESQRAIIPPPAATLAPGTAVGLSRGVWRGHRAVVKATHAGRAVVTVMLFGHIQDVHVATADLTPAADLAA
jgi:transcription antitermination factor NusG